MLSDFINKVKRVSNNPLIQAIKSGAKELNKQGVLGVGLPQYPMVDKALNPGSTFAEPYLKEKGVNPTLAFGVGLGIDVLAPGPGEIKGELKTGQKVVGKIGQKLSKPLPKEGISASEVQRIISKGGKAFQDILDGASTTDKLNPKEIALMEEFQKFTEKPEIYAKYEKGATDSQIIKEFIAQRNLSLPKEGILYHGTNNPEAIRKGGFSISKEAQKGSDFLGDNFVEGVHLSKSKAPYGEGGQLEGVREVLDVSTEAKNILKTDLEGIGKLYKKYGIDEMRPDYAQKLTDALKKDGYDGIEYLDEVVIFDPKKVKLTPSLPKEVGGLIEEARKYKSAEEFVKAQGEPFYHGTKAEVVGKINKQGFKEGKYEGELGKGVYLTKDKVSADLFGGVKESNVIETYLPNIKSYELPNFSKDPINQSNIIAKQIIEKDTLPPTLKGMSKSELAERIRETWGREDAPRYWLERAGYDGLTDSTSQIKDQIVIFDPSKIKTKSQLTKLWEQANKK